MAGNINAQYAAKDGLSYGSLKFLEWNDLILITIVLVWQQIFS